MFILQFGVTTNINIVTPLFSIFSLEISQNVDKGTKYRHFNESQRHFYLNFAFREFFYFVKQFYSVIK
jgi:hypothetical protein